MASLASFWPFGSSGPATVTATEPLTESLYDWGRDIRLQTVRPYKQTDDGLERGMKLLARVYTPDIRWRGLRNRSDPFAFELHYTDDTELLQARVATKTDEQFDRVNRQIQAIYPDSDTSEIDPEFLDVQPGQHVAGTVLQLRQRSEIDRLRPIKNFRTDADHFEIGPFRSIGKEMVGVAHQANCDVLVQSVIKPAVSTASWERLNWWYGIEDTINAVTGTGNKTGMDWGEVGRSIAEPFQQLGMSEERREREYRRKERRRERQRERDQARNMVGGRFSHGSPDATKPGDSTLAKLLQQQHGMRGYHLCLRVLAVSDDKETAQQRVANTASMFQSFYDSQFQQGFTSIDLSPHNLWRMVKRAAGRQYTDRKVTFPVDTLAGVCKIPTDIELQQFDYSMSASGMGVPPRTPRFNWDAVGIDRATASRAERQRALLAIINPTHPIWYGFGTKNEIEAGVEPEILSVHQFVGGSTGMGKTTLLINFFYQIMQRGHGGLFFDPKGQDADDIVKILPEHRTDDLVFIDIGADAEFEIGFNFLEIPLEDPDPESNAFDSAVSALADDLESLLAQAGGEGSQWGARMGTVTRAVVRGLAEYQVRTGRAVTMLDMAFLLADEEGRNQLHAMMTEERIQWIQQATHVIADYTADELEPLRRRLWEWTFSRTVRAIASHPTTTISIEEIVQDGKIVVVRNRASGDTPKRLIATALIRRLWVAIREQTNRETVADPPPFFAVCDEFDKIVSKHSDIHNILREARAFDFSMTLSAQNLNTGGDDDVGIPESIQKAIRGNCKTFLSFDPGEDDATGIARQHSRNVTAEDVAELSPYRIYMRTRNDRDNKTDSYKVKAFPPAEEVLETVRSDEEKDALIRTSQERYGQPKRSDEEIREEMLIDTTASGGSSDGTGSADTDALELTDTRQAMVCKAVNDAGTLHGRDDGAVRVSDCADRIRTYLDVGDQFDTDEQLSALLNAIPTGEDGPLERWADDNDDVWLRCTAEGRTDIYDVGGDITSGGWNHDQLLRDGYPPLLRAGLRLNIFSQTGATKADGSATVDVPELHNVEWEALADADKRALTEAFVDKQPALARVALGHDAVRSTTQATEETPALSSDDLTLAVEAEHSTGKSNPFQTCLNVAKAVNAGQRCLLLCRPDTAEQVWKTLTTPPFVSQRSDVETGEYRLYNGKGLTIGDEQILRPAEADETVWIHDIETGEYICGDSDGNEYHRFGSAKAVFEDAGAYPATLPKNADIPVDLTEVKIPFISERMFADGELPDPTMWSIVIVPPDAEGPADLALYDGEPIPFSDLAEEMRETDTTDGTAGQDHDADAKRREETAADDGDRRDDTEAADGTEAGDNNADTGHTPFDGSIDALDDLSLPDLNSETDTSGEANEDD